MVYETLCLGLTVAKTVGLYREQRRLRISTTLPSLLLRNGKHSISFLEAASFNQGVCQGVFYFGVLAVLSVLNIVAALVRHFTLQNPPYGRTNSVDV